MTFIEFIGFIISLVAMIVLTLKRYSDEKKRRQNPELYRESEEERHQDLEEFLSSIDVDMKNEQFASQEPPVVPPPPPPVSRPIPKEAYKAGYQGIPKDFQFRSNLESHRHESKIEKRFLKTSVEDHSFEHRLLSPEFRKGESNPYEIVAIDRQPRIQKLLKNLPSLQEMVIIREIIGPPKGME